MSFKDIPFGKTDKFNVVVEISKGSQVKYEYDEELDNMKLDFIFQDDFGFIFNYGYIPETRGGDGDHMDALILTAQPIANGTVVPCRAIGVVELLDRGEEDNKILAVPLADPAAKSFSSWKDWPEDLSPIFQDFFQEIGRQKQKTMEIINIHDAVRAERELEKGREIYNKQKGA